MKGEAFFHYQHAVRRAKAPRQEKDRRAVLASEGDLWYIRRRSSDHARETLGPERCLRFGC